MTKAKGTTVEEVRHNKRLYGAFVTLPSGTRYYVAYRRHAEIFRGGRKSLSDALTSGVASWALDVVTLGQIKSRGIKLVAVQVRETQDFYVTQVDNFYDPGKITIHNYERRGGALQRYLPLQFWKKAAGAVSI